MTITKMTLMVKEIDGRAEMMQQLKEIERRGQDRQ